MVLKKGMKKMDKLKSKKVLIGDNENYQKCKGNK